MDKRFKYLKQRQQEKINHWLFEEYRRMWIKIGHAPSKCYNEEIIGAVAMRIEDAEIWLPRRELVKYFRSKKPRFRRRVEKEFQLETVEATEKKDMLV